MSDDYYWVTDDMYDEKLREIIDREPAGKLLRYAGVYESLSEILNDEILAELESERETPDED